jgi:hypothetical protein
MKFSGLVAAALTVGSALAAPTQKKADALSSVLSIASGLKADVSAELANICMSRSLSPNGHCG